MRKTGILLALVVVTIVTSGCCRSCRNFFRRGAPCGTAAIAPPMMGAPRPLGSPFVAAPQPTQVVVPQMVMPQAGCCCEPMVPPCQCCDPCPNPCVPCESGYIGGDCGCSNGEVVGQGEWFGGYVEGSGTQDGFVPQGTRTYQDPGPAGGK